MEDGAIVVAPGAELDEVLTGLGDHVAVQLNVERPLVGHHANVALLLHSLVAQHVLINQRYKFTMKQSASMDNTRGIKQQQQNRRRNNPHVISGVIYSVEVMHSVVQMFCFWYGETKKTSSGFLGHSIR